MPQCAALAGPAGPAFLFLPALCPFCLNFHQREALCFSVGKDGYFVSEGFSRQLPLATAAHNCPHGFNRAGLVPGWCRFPYPGSKITRWAHRGEFGFCSLAGTSQREYHAPFQNSHVKIQAEEKNHLCPAFENPSRLSSPLCASVSSNPVG